MTVFFQSPAETDEQILSESVVCLNFLSVTVAVPPNKEGGVTVESRSKGRQGPDIKRDLHKG